MKRYDVIQNQIHSIYVMDLPEIQADEVVENIKDILQNGVRFNKDNFFVHGFHAKHSTARAIHKETNVFDDLVLSIERKALEVFESGPFYEKENTKYIVKPMVYESWCAMYQKDDDVEWHRHGPLNRLYYNAVYYAAADDDTPIIFEDIHGKNLSIPAKKGSLIIFDANTNHMVPTVSTDKSRITFVCTIVLNMDFTREI